MVVPKSKYQGNSKQITTPQAAYELFTAIIKAEHKTDRDKEHFWAIGLNTRNNIKYIELVSLGTLSLILVHNHPSGDPEPSEEDLRITRRLIDAGKIIGIQVLDHVIIGQGADGYKSFKEGGLL
jgi:DNA repair protein RadC